MKRLLLICVPLVLPGLGRSAAVDESPSAKGREIFSVCAACHTSGQGVVNPGPELRGVVGRKAGTFPGFRYSRAMKNAKVVWSAETLDAYLANPQGLMPGNAMPYPGLPESKDRQELIAYLQTLK
ncbi:MAG: c-type cytochrome [Opitutus sp.]|nr:c-type cytochrome [Opitutus sp.]